MPKPRICDTCRHLIRWTNHGYQRVMVGHCDGCVDCAAAAVRRGGLDVTTDLERWAFSARLPEDQP